MKISGNEIKPGMLLEHKDDLWEVLKTQHVKPGKGGAFNQVELKSVKKGIGDSNIVLNFSGVIFTPGEYLYADEDGVIVVKEKAFL